jgi:hypothetical protein
MSYVIAAPEMMTAAASDLAAIGENVSAAHAAATAPAVALVPAAADEVSAAVTHLFSTYAQGFQSLAAKAATFHDQFVQTLKAGTHAYTATETSGAASLIAPIRTALFDWFRTWPPGIQNFVNNLALNTQLFAIWSLIIGFILFAWLASTITYIFHNPFAAIPQLLTSLGL